jgi:thiamine pyrophosphate-dependent acetolactate synthase large subunit-like protein
MGPGGVREGTAAEERPGSVAFVLNNRQYRAMRTGHLHHHPGGATQAAETWHGVTIDGPDYAELGKPFGLSGQKVEQPGAIRNVLREVKGGKTAIVNIVLSC